MIKYKKVKGFNKLKFQDAYDKGQELVKQKKMPSFRIEDEIIYVKKLTKVEFNSLKSKWKKHLLNAVENITEQNLYTSAYCQGYLEYQIADDNPGLLVKKYFYSTMNDIFEFEVIFE